MLNTYDKLRAQQMLGQQFVWGEWCKLGAIPKPPPEVHAAAGGGPLRPSRVSPFTVLLYIIGLPAWILIGLYGLAESALALLVAVFRPKKSVNDVREFVSEGSQKDAALNEHGLTQVFDGDWQGMAGQFLLRYYAPSSHPTRLVILKPGAIVFMAPPKRVTLGKRKKMQVLAELPVDQAVVENPLNGTWQTQEFRIRFADQSWFTLTATSTPSDIDACISRVRRRGNPDNYPVVTPF
ncbi:hypothetical protein [Streptomyces buecherae]|uniref:Uncharacterized protein n=1 Tax=Streptomyces buecherae TaxID=2763006 RepID=A0A7H8N7N1_9ACTN|nr:hypothetical protein [Streptomyces buecherae]QKW50425.1 hypothetical protein HUT08_13780 [Streptomyces buecherae]